MNTLEATENVIRLESRNEVVSKRTVFDFPRSTAREDAKRTFLFPSRLNIRIIRRVLDKR